MPSDPKSPKRPAVNAASSELGLAGGTAAAPQSATEAGSADDILHTIHEPLLILTEELRVVRANRAFHEFFKTAAESIHDCPLFEIADGQWNIPQLRGMLDELLLSRSEVRKVHVTQRFTGIGSKSLSLNAALSGGPGEFLILLAIEDTTACTAAHTQMRNAGLRKDDLLAMLAHELRSPLAPMRTALAVLARGDLDAEVTARAVAVLDRQLQISVRMVDDLIETARITSGLVTLKEQRLDLREVIRIAADRARPLVDARQHSLTLRLPERAVEIEGDPALLDQAFSNLLSNAIKYTPPGGILSVVLERSGAEAVVRVADNGAGIGPELLPFVFDLFVQGTRPHDRSQGGLGIGLSVVREIAELHGGSAEATSPGVTHGSEFFVRLPALPDSMPEPVAGVVAPAGEAFASRRILVVDDNVDAATMCALLLELEGHEIRTAYDGPSALESAQAFRPEIVFLDIGLPGMNGYEVARRLRQSAATSSARIVAVTGYDRAEDRRQSMEAGCDLHLVKPPAVQELTDAIAAYRGEAE